jgi:S1-C subfamily serine protease
MPYAQGIGFAVPINTAKSILGDLIEKGRVVRPKIGIHTLKVTKHLARYYGLAASEGAIVAFVEPYSPADEAGLRRGDIIERIDENKISEPSEIAAHIRKKKIGDKITIAINRNGKTTNISVQLDDGDANSYVRAVRVE